MPSLEETCKRSPTAPRPIANGPWKAPSLTGASLTIDQFAEQGDYVASRGRFSATVKTTGKRLDVSIAHFFDVRAGKVVRFEDFMDTAATPAAHSASSHARSAPSRSRLSQSASEPRA